MAKVPTLKLRTGFEMPAIGLGTWRSKPGEVEKAVKAAIELGYRHIDCAYIHQNEAEVGNAIQAKLKEGTVTRDELFISSKLWNTFHRSDLVEKCLLESLQALQLDYLDLYLIHWPMAYKEDTGMLMPKDENGKIMFSEVDFVETWKAMEKLMDSGSVRSIGMSNFNSKQIQRILNLRDLQHKPANVQVEINPYHTNAKLLDFCRSRNIVVTASAPLGSPDRPWVMPDDPKPIEEPGLVEIARKYNKTPAQVILRWGTQLGHAVIPKSVTPSRILENYQIFDFTLTKEEMDFISGTNRDYRACHQNWVSHHPHFPFSEEF